MTVFDVRHATIYVYDDEVSASYGHTHLLPREFDGQTVRSSKVTITPAPKADEQHVWQDHLGNRAASFAIHRGHTRLEVRATSTIEVTREAVAVDDASVSWEDAVGLAAAAMAGTAEEPGDPSLSEFVLASPSVPVSDDLRAFADQDLTPGRSLLDALAAMAHRIHDEFEFVPGATNVTTRVEEVLETRTGVCQDYAHLMIGSLRSVGLPARYVSGYLETLPPPGQERLAGADVSHAWVQAWVPELGWVDVDPTNDQFVGDQYITTAWGRDYGDVTPLKGVIFTDGRTDTLTVTVDVLRVPDAP